MKPFGIDIPDLASWWDFSRVEPDVGASLPGIEDLYNVRHLTQALESRRPSIVGINGRKAASFLATSTQFLSGSSFPDLNLPVTILAVVSNVTPAGTRYMGLGSGNLKLGTNINGGIALGSNIVPVDTGLHVITSIFNGANSIVRRDGAQIAVGDAGSLDPGTTISIGALLDATVPWNGVVGEVILVADVPSDDLVRTIENALGYKWDLGFGEPVPLEGEVSETLVGAHEPWLTGDLEAYLRVIGAMFGQVELYAFDTEDYEGWQILLDPDRCPVEALPYLAQYVGERLPKGILEADARQWIKDAPNQIRGTLKSISIAAKRHLLEPKTVTIIQRAGGNPDRLDVVSYTSQTPDSAAVLRELQTTVPADITLTYTVTSGQTWTQLATIKPTWANVVSDYATWADVTAATPSGSF